MLSQEIKLELLNIFKDVGAARQAAMWLEEKEGEDKKKEEPEKGNVNCAVRLVDQFDGPQGYVYHLKVEGLPGFKVHKLEKRSLRLQTLRSAFRIGGIGQVTAASLHDVNGSWVLDMGAAYTYIVEPLEAP